MENIRNKITQNVQKYKYFVIFLLIGICFMVLSVPNQEETVVSVNESFNIEEVEEKLEEILAQIDKVGDVCVMITTKSGLKSVYATNTTENSSQNGDQTSQDTKTDYVLISPSNSSEQPIKIYDIYPEIQGILVVCQGADLSEVKLEILQAVRSLCDISSENITISKMKE